MLQKRSVAISTDASGDATVYAGDDFRKPGPGKVVMIKYEPGTLDTGADLTITGEDSEVPILTKANCGTSDVWYFPAALATSSADGAAGVDAFRDIYIQNERIKVVVAQGGNAKAGTITFFVETTDEGM